MVASSSIACVGTIVWSTVRGAEPKGGSGSGRSPVVESSLELELELVDPVSLDVVVVDPVVVVLSPDPVSLATGLPSSLAQPNPATRTATAKPRIRRCYASVTTVSRGCYAGARAVERVRAGRARRLRQPRRARLHGHR